MKPIKQIPLLPPGVTPDNLVNTLNDRLRKLLILISEGNGGGQVLFGSHGARAAMLASDNPNAVYFETDRNYVVYLSDGKAWHFAGGIMYGLLADRPTGLSSNDEGFYYIQSDAPGVLWRWTKGEWVVALGVLPWSFKGHFDVTETYSKGDVISFAGVLWISAGDENLNNVPTDPPFGPPIWLPANWLHLAGVASFAGEEWNNDDSYNTDDVVSYLGDLWIAIAGSTHVTPGVNSSYWFPLDADNIINMGALIGYGVNMKWAGHSWMTGFEPDNGAGAILTDSVTGITALYALPEVPNTTPPNEPKPQFWNAAAMALSIFLSADPRTTKSLNGSYPYLNAFWPLYSENWLLVFAPDDIIVSAVRVKFDITPLLPGDHTYILPDGTDPVAGNIMLAGKDPCHGGTGILNVPADGMGWELGSLLIGSGEDTTELLAQGAEGDILRVYLGHLEWAPQSDANPGTYGDATHSAQIVIDITGRIQAISNIPITPSGGFNGTVALAKLTGGGADGALTVVNGIITGVLPPS